ncbi:MAG: hypothetical protein V4508_06915 [Pseudomonadota bacterium]
MTRQALSSTQWKFLLATIAVIFLGFDLYAVSNWQSALEAHRTVEFLSQLANVSISLVLALVIGMRRPDSLAMRAFALGLLIDSPDFFCSDFSPAGPLQVWLDQIFHPATITFYYLSFLYFTLSFPEDRQWIKLAAVRKAFLTFGMLFVLVTLVVILDAAHLLPAFAAEAAQGARQLRPLLAMVSVTVSLFALYMSWRRSSGPMAQRLAWIGLCMGAITATYFVSNLNRMTHIVPDTVLDAGQFIVTFVAYAGFAYAMLRHRLFDVGFAVNRALVFTIISTFLLLVFAVTEWSVDKLLHFQGREKNILFDAAVALAIILSFHRIQHWVSHKVDHIFYHHWYASAEKLRHFIERAVHITDVATLREKYAHAIQAFSGADGIAIYANDTDEEFTVRFSTQALAPARLEPNHEVVIDLKHTRQAVELDGQLPGLPGTFAFPIMTRGRISGALLLGAKPNGQQLRPDELVLLTKCVLSLGMATESLRVEELERTMLDMSSRAEFVEQKCLGLEQVTTVLEREVAGLRQQASTA